MSALSDELGRVRAEKLSSAATVAIWGHWWPLFFAPH